MTYLVCIGRSDAYGNFATGNPVGATPSGTVYGGFRFRDIHTPEVGRTRVYSDITSLFLVSGTDYYKDSSTGLLWRSHDGNKPDDHQFSRRPWGKILDNRRDSAWQFGTQTTAKNNPSVSTNEGYLMSSTWKILKERGILG